MAFEKTLYAEQIVDRPLEEVFAFFAKAENLQEITPPLLDFHIVTKLPVQMRAGTLIDYKLKVRGVPMKWKTLIEKWDPPHCFVDTQLKGPYSLWHHTHEFVALSPNKTLLKDTVRYRLPFGPLGMLVERLFVRRDIESIFAFRKAEVERRFP